MEKIIEIVREAAGLMVRSGFEIHHKGSVENLVTSSDLAVQHFLTERLGNLLPGSGFLCEEEDLADVRHSELRPLFDYTSTSQRAGTWEIKNLRIVEK